MIESVERRQPIAAQTRLRTIAASFWLTILFRLVAISPLLVRSARPILIRLAIVFSKKIRRNTNANARRILPPPLTAAQCRKYQLGVVGAFYDFICDIGQSLRQTPEQLAGRIESADGVPAYQHTRARCNGAILLTAHMGSFEVGLVALAKQERRIHVVFKRDDVSSFEALRSQLRKQLAVIEAPIENGLQGWLKLRAALQNDEVVAIQGDRVMPGEKGFAVPLLRGTVLLPTGPFKLALASGSPVVPIFSIRSPRGGVRIYLEDAITVSTERGGIEIATRQFADVLSKYINAYPEQWLVLDRTFGEDNI